MSGRTPLCIAPSTVTAINALKEQDEELLGGRKLGQKQVISFFYKPDRDKALLIKLDPVKERILFLVKLVRSSQTFHSNKFDPFEFDTF